MTVPENATPPRHGRGEWRKRLALGMSALLALLLLFHRPLLIGALHATLVRMAARQNVALSFKPEGTLLTGITLSNVRAVPLGRSPVDLIAIERLEIHYDLIHLLRYGIRDFVSAYDLRHARLALSPFKGTVEQKQELNQFLRAILQQPALFSDHVKVENLDITINTPDGPFVLGGINARLDPSEAGFIRMGELTIPKIASWHNIHTSATYIDRHFIARDFDFGNDIHAVRLELDGSQWAKGVSFLSFEGTVLGGNVGMFLWRKEVAQNTISAQFTASVSDLSLKRVHDFLRWMPEVTGEVSNATFRLVGNPDNPSSWEGGSTIHAGNVAVSGVRMEQIAADLEISRGAIHLNNGKIATGANQLSVRIEQGLPDSFGDLLASGVGASLELNAPDLSALYVGITSGTLHGDGQCRITQKAFTLALNTAASGVEGRVQGDRFSLTSGTGEIRLGYEIRRRPQGAPWFDGLLISTNTGMSAICLGSYVLDSGTASASLREGNLKVDSGEFHRGPNSLRFGGQYEIQNSLTPDWASTKLDLHWDIDAPSLAEFSATPKLVPLNGSVSASGTFHHTAGEIGGFGTLEGRDLVFREFSARRLSINVPVEHNAARRATLDLDINGTDKLAAEGSLTLKAPFVYDARLSGNVHDISIFQPLAGMPMAGSLEVDWHGTGELQLIRHTGEGRIALRKGRVESFTGIDAEVAGVYSPESISLSTFGIRSDQGAVRAQVNLRDEQLHLDQLRLELAKIGVVTGSLVLPVDLRTATRPDTVFPSAGAVTASLILEPVDLARAFPAPKPDLAVSGRVNGSLTAAGTIDDPRVTVVMQGRDLRAMVAKNLPLCSATALLNFANDRLTLTGSLTQPGISPLRFAGAMPLSPKRVLQERRVDPSTPITAAVKLSPSAAAFLAQFVPEIRYSEGKISVDAAVAGTLEKPMLSGGIVLDLPAVRFQDANLPGIGDFHGDLRFSGKELTLRRFQGDVGGGPFAATGRVTLEDMLDPQLDLRLRSQGTLLARNDSLTLRADSDLRITGPLNTAQVTGKIGITKSRFVQDMEILPIGLPGQAPPKRTPGRISFSLDAPPFRGWKFDVSVKTKEPFVVRGNMANGLATADFHLGGTGFLPTLEGAARVENLVASLPFSKLTIDYGYLYFSADDPFNPSLDIHGTSRMTDYNINVYIFGTAAEPQTLFTSEPSLPQEEVVSLLATGATQQQIAGNNQILATRAGVLLLQDLYHKIFKRHTPPTSSDQPLDRFSMDVGTVDPRTGRQEVNGRYKLSKEVEVSAGLDVQGDVQVQIGYLLRFR